MTTTKEEFKKCDSIGKQGEYMFEKYCKNKHLDYRDATKHEYFQSVDVDFVIRYSNDSYEKVEVKTQQSLYKYKNMFVEDIQFNGKDGWLRYCQADTIALYCGFTDVKHNKIMYLINFKELKELINHNHCKVIEKGNARSYLVKLNNIEKLPSTKIIIFNQFDVPDEFEQFVLHQKDLL